jgi:phospholipid-binding lipoprotein MlaA
MSDMKVQRRSGKPASDRHPVQALPSFLALVLVGGLLLSGCATHPDPEADPEGYAEYLETNDPIEPFNRGVFAFNRGLDKFLLTPLAIFYKDILPPPIQRGTHNVLQNLQEPVTFFNNLLQGEPERAATTLGRFAVNTTIGVAGINDFASDFGWEFRLEDFGQTLAVWGVESGPYLMLPVLGPSNPRDGVGRAVDSLILDPFGLLGAIVFRESDFLTIFSITRFVLTAADQRARVFDEFEELERTSLDFYAAVRSAYRQNRDHEIKLRD